MRKKYLRRNTEKYKRLGSSSKKKQVWRKARGRDNKIRESRKGRPGKPEIGERKTRKLRGNILGKVPIIIGNKEELKKVKPGQLVVIAKLGKKKRQELIKEIENKNLLMFKNKQTKKHSRKKIEQKEIKAEESEEGKKLANKEEEKTGK